MASRRKPKKKTVEVKRLERNIRKLRRQLKASWLEWTLRGRELEQINKLITGWRSQIPQVLHKQLRSVLDGYTDRCPPAGDKRQKQQ